LQELVSKYPDGMIAQEANRQDLYDIAWTEAWPKIRTKAIEDYWENHSIEKWLTGGRGMGSGGFKTFVRVLDAVGSNR
jgi:hypothetical protein